MNDFEKQLKQELIDEGASLQEANSLVEFKNKISKLSNVRRSDDFKRTFLRKLEEKEVRGQFFVPRRLFTPAFLIALLMFVLVTGVVSAQYSQPGQTLYPVKILSENIIKTVNPSFKDEILKRRSEEIKTITEQKKDSGQLNKTINKYENDLDENQNVNPTQIQQSKRNLEDARDNSEDGDRTEIEHVIKQTEDKINESQGRNEENNIKGVTESVGHENSPEQKSSGQNSEDHGQSQDNHGSD